MGLYSAAGYLLTQCTGAVQSLAGWAGGTAGHAWGDAHNWLAAAQAQGYQISPTPVVGSVAVWGAGMGGADSRSGHVALVSGIQSNGLAIVQEANVPEGNGSIQTHNLDPFRASGIIGYILPPGSAGATAGTASGGTSSTAGGLAVAPVLGLPGVNLNPFSGFFDLAGGTARRGLTMTLGILFVLMGVYILFHSQVNQVAVKVAKSGAAAAAA